jgi:excisionase family DNA binding protein
MSEGKLLTVPEVAARLRVGEESVRRWLRQGRLRGIQPGGTKIGWRVLENELERFIREGGRTAESPTNT